ncbi:MAG: hypothetical protein IPK99_03870 [Flavobacteriales bacterium]|nr:hypothetical protein [Flavobacteriales bacterium]
MILSLATAAFLLMGVGCGNTAKSTVGPSDQSTSKYGGTNPADSLFFSIERTPCFGKCPAYRIKVYRSGYATYEGISNVERLGMNRGQVGLDTLAVLLKEAEAIGYFDLQDSYDRQVTDIPSTRLRMVSGARDKAILARAGVPPELKAFALRADELLLPMKWERAPELGQ